MAILFASVPLGAVADPQSERLAVIVSTGREAPLSMQEISQIYLKQRRFWKEGEPIVPVNRQALSWERRAFTRRIFDKEVRQLEIYWNRQYFRGILPPATLASDEAVRRFVALDPNAIGYIRESLLDKSVRVVIYLDLD